VTSFVHAKKEEIEGKNKRENEIEDPL